MSDSGYFTMNNNSSTMLAAIGVTAPIASDYPKYLKRKLIWTTTKTHKPNKEQIKQKETKIKSKARTT